MDTPTSLRTTTGELAYQQAKQDGKTRALKDEPSLIDFKHWRLINNSYPYNMAFSTHDMLIPKRIFPNRSDMTVAEAIELNEIVDELSNQYDVLFENINQRRSVPGHYHVHLALYHRKREEMHL